jgi:hypothetical protein
MAKTGRDMSFENPMQSFSKEVEDIGCGTKAKGEDNIVIEPIIPSEAQKVPVSFADRYLTKGLFQI